MNTYFYYCLYGEIFAIFTYEDNITQCAKKILNDVIRKHNDLLYMFNMSYYSQCYLYT